MGEKGKTPLEQAAAAIRDQKKLRELMSGGDARRMMELLTAQGGVQEAARAAAAGDPARLLEMMQKLTGDREGAQLVERIRKQAEQSGL